MDNVHAEGAALRCGEDAGGGGAATVPAPGGAHGEEPAELRPGNSAAAQRGDAAGGGARYGGGEPLQRVALEKLVGGHNRHIINLFSTERFFRQTDIS